MAASDPRLQRKINQQLKRATKAQTKFNNTASDASKMAGQAALVIKSPEQIELGLLSTIENLCIQGEFMMTTGVPPTYINNVLRYFSSKGYIVARAKDATSSNNILIAWIGGRSWAKSVFGKQVADSVRIDAALKKLTEYAVSKLKVFTFINPTTSDPMSKRSEFARLMNKYR